MATQSTVGEPESATPEAIQVREYPHDVAPAQDGKVWYTAQGTRRVWSDSQGRLWVTEWNAGQLARYDPASGAWAEWRAPGDAPRVYAVYVDETGRVWASEWTAQAMLRFDPATQRFEAFRSSSRHANVRQINGRKGAVWTPDSGADKLVAYRFRSPPAVVPRRA